MPANRFHADDSKPKPPPEPAGEPRLDETFDWVIRSSANAGLYVPSIERALPSKLLAGKKAQSVVKSVGQKTRTGRRSQPRRG